MLPYSRAQRCILLGPNPSVEIRLVWNLVQQIVQVLKLGFLFWAGFDDRARLATAVLLVEEQGFGVSWQLVKRPR